MKSGVIQLDVQLRIDNGLMARNVPFKISARTARLIGRQNFSSADGAIIELIKNSYDADADTCIVVFDDKYSVSPPTLSPSEYLEFTNQEELISRHYVQKSQGEYTLKDLEVSPDDSPEECENERRQLQAFFRSKCKIHIIDNGEGMTEEVIENHWMTIGTNNKEHDVFTRKGRIKTGEKGIGRFALDRLGNTACMLTKPDQDKYYSVDPQKALLWQVDWSAFEGNSKTLNQVEANLREEQLTDLCGQIRAVLRSPSNAHPQLHIESFKSGTLIEISDLRDEWDHAAISKLFTNLEVLIPAREERVFNIFLFSQNYGSEFGQVLPSVCDDYDYKVVAQVDPTGITKITIHRNEFDLARIPPEFFLRPRMREADYSSDNFQWKSSTVTRRISQLAPGLKEVDAGDTLQNIGPFEFVFYFMKRQQSKRDDEIFRYKSFNNAARKAWFQQFGGIKLFRDSFRVRPYGEVNSPAFDWLQLGERAARSPAGFGKLEGGWKVRPNQVAGIINISRLTNINFEDKSNREGLQENEYFGAFTSVIEGIIDVFERDRQRIGRELRELYWETHPDEVTEERAETAKQRVRSRARKQGKSQAEEDADTLLKYAELLEDQIEELRDETKLMMILATSGLVVASFTHELRNIKKNLVVRMEELLKAVRRVVDDTRLVQLPAFHNPYVMIEDIKKEDIKLKEWLHYSLETLRRDKRRRKDRDLIEYLEDYRKSWCLACSERGVKFDLQLPLLDDLTIRVFEADLDSIFNNLLINSFEAFLRKDAPSERTVSLRLEVQGRDVHFFYSDSGPGLSKDIVDPQWIFTPFTTTKRDPHSKEITGTGLGMWLVKSLVEENGGTIKLLHEPKGFGVHIILPDKVE